MRKNWRGAGTTGRYALGFATVGGVDGVPPVPISLTRERR